MITKRFSLFGRIKGKLIKDPIYGREKIFKVADEVVNTYIFRPIGWPVAKSLEKTPVTPNQLTFVGLLFGIASGISYFQGGGLYYFLGALFLFIASVLDCADGPLARIKNMQSEFGKILEGMADYTVGISAFLGISLSLFREVEHKSWTFWAIAITFLILILIQNIHWDYCKIQFMSIMKNGIFEPAISFEDFCQKHAGLKYDERKIIGKISIFFYYLCIHGAEKVLSPTIPYRGKEAKYFNNREKKQYYKRYNLIMRLWAWNAAKTKIAFIVLCTAINQPVIMINGLLWGFNILWLITLITHKINFFRGK